MAELVVLDGEQYKRRNPWGAWGWCWLIIPYYVWYHRLNDEARRYLKDQTINPALAMLSQLVPIVHWISIWRTGERINRMQAQAGLQPSVLPILGLVASLFYFLHVVYYQSELNQVWGAALATSGRGQIGIGTPGSGPPPPPPPPPPAPTG